MSVKNVRVKYIRKEGYNNLKEWINDPNNVYVGRGEIVFINGTRYPPTSSPFCNPFKIVTSRDECIDKFREYIIQKIETDPNLKNELLNMKDKNLGCWCHPEKCHADVLLELINYYSTDISLKSSNND